MTASDSEKEDDHACPIHGNAEAKDYTRKIKDAGFTRNATEEEQAGVYDYTADDGTVKVSISALPGDNGTININKLP